MQESFAKSDLTWTRAGKELEIFSINIFIVVDFILKMILKDHQSNIRLNESLLMMKNTNIISDRKNCILIL